MVAAYNDDIIDGNRDDIMPMIMHDNDGHIDHDMNDNYDDDVIIIEIMLMITDVKINLVLITMSICFPRKSMARHY